MLTEVQTGSLAAERLTGFLDPPEAERLRAASERARSELRGRSIVNVNSTARGGGVAEMLLPLVAYARGLGVDARWLVTEGGGEFFRITKRIHNRLHGVEGDGRPLGAAERAAYEACLHTVGRELLGRLDANDIVILHDPQTAGLIPTLAGEGIPVIWRCHVGVDNPNELARSAWRFLNGYVNRADRVVFSREQFAWDDIEPSRRVIIPPSIDALGPKNQGLRDGTCEAILRAAGLRAGRTGGADAVFVRLDGRTASVRRPAQLDEDRPLDADARYVLQVSRWDRLKDPLGVIDGFAAHIAPGTDAHLVYAGPDVRAVSDDPEGVGVLRAAHERRAALPRHVRERVHLALLPMDDLEENGAIVNALQRRATVVVQKSLAEGFGLTVAEAMWKARPVVASRIGGIRDQIEHGHSGLLLDDPADLREYGAAVRRILGDTELAVTLGSAARERVRGRFLATHSLLEYLALIETILHDREAAA